MTARYLTILLFAVALYMGDRVVAGFVQCDAAGACPWGAK